MDPILNCHSKSLMLPQNEDKRSLKKISFLSRRSRISKKFYLHEEHEHGKGNRKKISR